MGVYKVGDLVRLKSGGPIMTVIEDAAFENQAVYVQWFNDNNKEQSASFPEAALEHASRTVRQPPDGGVGKVLTDYDPFDPDR